MRRLLGIIWEFGGDIPVIFANLTGKVETVQMKDLLPRLRYEIS